MGIIINRRRTYGGGKTLPYDAEIEYLESTGTQYINTGIDATSVYGLEFKFIPISGSSGTFASILSGVLDDFTMGYVKLDYDSVYIRYRGDEVMRPTISTSSYNTLLLSGNTLSLADTSVRVATPVAKKRGYLMLANNSALSRYSHVRFSTLKIYGSNNTLLRDFITVRVGSTGYMYDNVSGQFFGNNGTGNFILGADKN